MRRHAPALSLGVGLLIAGMAALADATAPASFPPVVELSSLDGTTGFVINGIDAEDGSGGVVSGAGDVNGDGIGDLLMSAIFASQNGMPDAGESYVVFGRATGFAPSFELSSLEPQAGGDGSAGFILRGIWGRDESGQSVSGAGDVNGDGIGDLIIGASGADPNGFSAAGESYVVFGRPAGFPAAFELRSLHPQAGGDGTAGFIIKGVDAGDLSGHSVSDAGDVNGDGIADLIIGAHDADANGMDDPGESYVVFGRATGFPAAFELRSLYPQAGGDGSAGFVVRGIDSNDASGDSVSGAGDVNGDGIADLLIGATGADPNTCVGAGETYVVFGRTTGFPAVFELRSLHPRAGGDGSEGVIIKGIGSVDLSGESVSGVGDLNDDGIDDLLIGAMSADPGGRTSAGESYMVFGRATGFPAAFELRSLEPQSGGDGSAGFVLEGVDYGDSSGHSVSGAGDVNGDGIADLLIGAQYADRNERESFGESYVVFGRATGFPVVFELRSLYPQAGGDGSAGFVIKGVDTGDLAGESVSGAGDVNGDGIADLVIGAARGDPNGRRDAGESYVVFGRAAPAR